MRGARLEAEDIEDDREDPIEDDEPDDRRHHRGGRRQADRGRAAARLHPAEAAGERHDHAEHRALGDADQEVTHVYGRASLLEILGVTQAQHAETDDGAAEDPDQVRVDGEQGHHGDEREHPRQHQEFHRGDAHGGERVDLLIRVHRAELSRERGAGSACHDDGGHDAADLARHRDRDQVGDEDRGPELLELDGADEREDQPDQEADQAHDAERARAALLHDQKKIRDTKPRAPTYQGTEGNQALAEEPEPDRDGSCRRDRVGAETRQPRRLRARASGLLFWYGFRHRDQPANAVGEPRTVGSYAPGLHLAEHLEHERDQSRVPRSDLPGVERKVADSGRLQLTQRARRLRQSALAQPVAGELQHRAVRLWVSDGQRRVGYGDRRSVHVELASPSGFPACAGAQSEERMSRHKISSTRTPCDRPSEYQSTSAPRVAVIAARMETARSMWPEPDRAPAPTSMGTAGAGSPACTANAQAKTTAAP